MFNLRVAPNICPASSSW